MPKRQASIPEKHGLECELPLLALNSINLGFAITSRADQDHVVFCNDALEQILNSPRESLIGCIHPFLLPNAIPFAAQQAIRNALVSAGSMRTVVKILRTDEIESWISLSVYPIASAGKSVTHFVWQHEDIGHRVASEELWKRFEAIVNSSREFMALISIDRTIALANGSFSRALGLPPDTVTGSHLQSIWGKEEYQTKIEPQLARCFRGDSVRFRDSINLPNAAGQYHELAFYPFSSKGTEVTHAVFVSRNITPLKESEDALRRLNTELEQRVRDRTAELNAILRDLEAFNYSIAHDLRAPLRFVNAFAQILEQQLDAKLQPDAVEYTHNVLEGVKQMDKLIDALLEFSRSGSKPLNRRPVDLGMLAREVVDALRQDPRHAHIAVSIQEISATSADPALLKQVLTNLIGNAMKFTRQSELPRIEIGCQRRATENVYYIRDNGCGFDMRFAEEIFGVFKRLPHEDDVEGSGVGLAIVKRIIERHGGRIWAEGKPGQGAAFYFTLDSGSSFDDEL